MDSDVRKPLLSVTYRDPLEGWEASLVIDSLTNGVAAGGTRVTSTVDIVEVERLARAMTYKCRSLGLCFGGAKIGVRRDPNAPQLDAALVRFFEHIRPICESMFSFGPDMGTTEALLDDVCTRAGMIHRVQAVSKLAADPPAVIERYRRLSRLSDGRFTVGGGRAGAGVAQAAHAAAEFCGVKNARVAIQGFGAVGASAAWYLSRLGHGIVAVADLSGCFTRPDGFDVAALVDGRPPLLGENREANRGTRAEGEQIIATDCDVLVLAASADAVRRSNVESVRARAVVEGGNLVVTDAATLQLHARGIPSVPDFIASAGAIAFTDAMVRGTTSEDGARILSELGEIVGRATARALRNAADRRLPVRHSELLTIG